MANGPLHQEAKDGIYPRFTGEIPEGALYGLCDFRTGQWTGDWLFSEKEAQEDADGLGRSGLPISVLRIGGDWTNDADWVEQSGS